MLNFAPIEPLVLVKRLPYFDNLAELHVLLTGIVCLGFEDTIH